MNSMNENDARLAETTALQDGINDLRAYLLSDKFAVDSMVQVTDVLSRLREIESAASDAFYGVTKM